MFTDLQVQSLVAPHLAVGERVVARARGVEKPWYSRLFLRLGSLLWRNYLLVATDQRLFFLRHAGLLGGKKVKEVEALHWSEIDQARLGWGVFTKSVVVRASSRRFSRTVCLGRFWMKQNFPNAEAIVRTWSQARGALPSAPPVATLPSGYPNVA